MMSTFSKNVFGFFVFSSEQTLTTMYIECIYIFEVKRNTSFDNSIPKGIIMAKAKKKNDKAKKKQAKKSSKKKLKVLNKQLKARKSKVAKQKKKIKNLRKAIKKAA